MSGRWSVVEVSVRSISFVPFFCPVFRISSFHVSRFLVRCFSLDISRFTFEVFHISFYGFSVHRTIVPF